MMIDKHGSFEQLYFFLKVLFHHRICSFCCQSGRCPLHWASSGGRLDIVEYLLQLKVDVDARDEVGSCLIWYLSDQLCPLVIE